MAQFENGCITIDFESFPTGETPMEGLPISRQYTPLFGLRFYLENGNEPILAEVGGTTSAFASSAGNDTPIPADAMGRFFLTDDGELSGLTTSALILDFQIPIDSFAGCIVDVDFSEQFIIHARDEFEQIILADTITDGDPGTGDGLLTCWGFNLPGCEGAVHSIRFAGTRTQTGAFGLGLDNFSFCYSGLNIDVDITDESCISPGEININSITTEVYRYSEDGINYDESGFFDELDAGTYRIFVIDGDGCETFVDIVIDPPPERELIATPLQTSCAEDNGEIILNLKPEATAMYSLDDGFTLQGENIFDNLSPGTYSVTVIDSLDCAYTQDIIIEPSFLPTISTASATIDSCNDSRGSLSIQGSNGMNTTGSFEYSLDNITFSEENIFYNLSSGDYTYYLRDINGCVVQDSLFIDKTPEVVLRSIDVTAPDCFTENGIIEIDAGGGSGILVYEINGNAEVDSIIDNLPFGNYELIIEDELGCSYTQLVTLESPTCPIYIPNVFTPNFDGRDDYFKAFTNNEYEVGIIDYRIYDRWGELVFVSGLYSIHTGEKVYWWDGYFNGKPAEAGVYAYMIEVRHPNETTELFSGDITLIR